VCSNLSWIVFTNYNCFEMKTGTNRLFPLTWLYHTLPDSDERQYKSSTCETRFDSALRVMTGNFQSTGSRLKVFWAHARSHQPSELDQTACLKSLIFTSARRIPAACGTHRGDGKNTIWHPSEGRWSCLAFSNVVQIIQYSAQQELQFPKLWAWFPGGNQFYAKIVW